MNAPNRFEGQNPVEFKGASTPLDTGRIDKLRADHEAFLKNIGVPKNQAERSRDPQDILKTEIATTQLGIERLYGEVEQLKKLSPHLVESRLATLRTYERIRDIKQEELERMMRKAA